MSTAHVHAASRNRPAVRPRAGGLLALVVAPATMIVILAVSLLLLMTPLWMHPALAATTAQTFATPSMAFDLSDRTIAELFAGPGTFSMFSADEAAHMRDVRVVLFGFLGVAAVSAVVLAAFALNRSNRYAFWRGVSRGGAVLVVALVVLGVVSALAFGIAFETFHRIFFPGGNWAFDESSWLIRLYPIDFWQWSAAAIGVLGIVGGAAAWLVGRSKANKLRARIGA